jgi:hypothetical protein
MFDSRRTLRRIHSTHQPHLLAKSAGHRLRLGPQLDKEIVTILSIVVHTHVDALALTDQMDNAYAGSARKCSAKLVKSAIFFGFSRKYLFHVKLERRCAMTSGKGGCLRLVVVRVIVAAMAMVVLSVRMVVAATGGVFFGSAVHVVVTAGIARTGLRLGMRGGGVAVIASRSVLVFSRRFPRNRGALDREFLW